MTSPKPIRWSGLAAMLGGVLWMVLVPLAGMTESRKVLGLTEGAYSRMNTASMVLLIGGLVGLHARQQSRSGRLGLAGFVMSFVALTLMFVGNVIEWWISDLAFDTIEGEFKPGAHAGWGSFLLGLVLLSVGLVLLGIATIRAKLLPRWSRVLPLAIGLLLASGFLVALSIGEWWFGVIILSLGLGWVLLGYVLWSDQEELAVQSDVSPPA